MAVELKLSGPSYSTGLGCLGLYRPGPGRLAISFCIQACVLFTRQFVLVHVCLGVHRRFCVGLIPGLGRAAWARLMRTTMSVGCALDAQSSCAGRTWLGPALSSGISCRREHASGLCLWKVLQAHAMSLWAFAYAHAHDKLATCAYRQFSIEEIYFPVHVATYYGCDLRPCHINKLQYSCTSVKCHACRIRQIVQAYLGNNMSES